MRMRDKIITAACLTKGGIEWTTLKVKPDGPGPAVQDSLPLAVPDGSTADSALATVQLPDGIADKLTGDLTASIRTAELLMRTMKFPTTDAAEIAGMVAFQIDKVSPFPLDQLAVSHEVLQSTEDGTLVLMVAAKRECIDTIGDAFGKKGIHIHSMDARVLGWIHLLQKGSHVSGEGCEILIIDDGIDFALAVLLAGAPIAFRSLPAKIDAEGMVDELAYEIGYTLTMLDAEHDLPVPSAIEIWSLAESPFRMMAKLREKTGIPVRINDLSSLPPLSEGILDRALNTQNRIELIPHEWIEHERNKRLRRKFTAITVAILGVWLSCLLVLVGVYQARAIKLARIQKQADALAPAAAKAFENRKKLGALKIYTDRSNSSLECLREVTRLLPASDIEFDSYNYNKGKAVTLRGSAAADDAVYDFFGTLTASPLFKQLKDQSVNTRVTKGVRRSVFTVTLVLPPEEEGQ